MSPRFFAKLPSSVVSTVLRIFSHERKRSVTDPYFRDQKYSSTSHQLYADLVRLANSFSLAYLSSPSLSRETFVFQPFSIATGDNCTQTCQHFFRTPDYQIVSSTANWYNGRIRCVIKIGELWYTPPFFRLTKPSRVRNALSQDSFIKFLQMRRVNTRVTTHTHTHTHHHILLRNTFL